MVPADQFALDGYDESEEVSRHDFGLPPLGEEEAPVELDEFEMTDNAEKALEDERTASDAEVADDKLETSFSQMLRGVLW